MVTVRDVVDAAVTSNVTLSIFTVFDAVFAEKLVPVRIAGWPSTIGSGDTLEI
jgi:hypothetical protein